MPIKTFKLEEKQWNVNIQEELKIRIVKGNTKVKDTLIFSLPPIRTCPKATEQCKSQCYALKFYRVNHRVRTAWEENLLLSFTDRFIQIAISEISKITIKKEYRYFRMNDSGDFYNQSYLNKWIEIAKEFPNIKFLAYTKSYNLDYSKLPTNFKVRYSIFPDTTKRLENLPFAYLDGCGERGKIFHCKLGSTCGKCRICWDSDIDVKFTLH